MTAPDATRVIEQSFEFDLVSTESSWSATSIRVVTVDQLAGNRVVQFTGRLLSTQGGLVLAAENGEIHTLNSYPACTSRICRAA